MDINGLPVTLLDTAGLRATDDPVEAMGIARAVARAQRADLRVYLVADDNDIEILRPVSGDLVVWGKADLSSAGGFAVSGMTGEGVDALVSKIGQALVDRTSAAATITRARHRDAVDGSIRALELALAMLEERQASEEIVADVLRQAVVSMDGLIGKVGVEDLLGDIFASFCIGK
jgi:tRNA modification GTPase